MRDEGNTLPFWLRRAGYRTGFVGKFMNGFAGRGLHGPPGWDHWFLALGDVDYFEFEVSSAGELRRYSGEYATDVYTAEGKRFIRGAVADRDPFFLWLSYNAPHIVDDAQLPCTGRMPEPAHRRDYERFADAELPRSPRFDEEDASDKVSRVRSQPRISPRHVAEITTRWRCTLASLQGVDRGIRSLVRSLRELEVLDETVIVFVSDNGYFFGEHRLRDNKRLPYDPALRVPLAIHAPGDEGASAGEIEQLVSTVDIAPTLLDYAGARPCPGNGRCRKVDGRSLRPLLGGGAASWPDDRAIPISLDDGVSYTAIRTLDHLYVEFERGFAGRRGSAPPAIELYDLNADPHQLRNLWHEDRSAARPLLTELKQRLRGLARCAGTRRGDPNACE